MSGRLATLEYNLSLLQDCIRRDPESYKDEFMEQYRHFEHTLQLFRLQPSLDPTRLLELIHFHSHVAHCYQRETKTLSNDLMDLLRHNADGLHPQLRLGTAKALALLRNKNLAPPLACLQLFFDLSKCRDKELRKFLFTSTVQYVKLLNTKGKDAKMNGELQRFVLAQLQTANSSKVMARMALLLLIDLYRRRLWVDAKTVNAIALGGCLSNVTKLSATACKFFLGKELDEEGGASSDEEEKNQDTTSRTLKEVMVGYKAGRKTKRRQRALDRAKQTIEKVQKRRNKTSGSKDVGTAALRLLYDPQEFGEQLFRKVQSKSKNERFEFRMLVVALVARVIGLHKLQVLNFYPFLLRYLQPKQQDVTKILLFAAQASHELVPPDSVEIVVKTIVNNFVSDRNSPEAITVGLNACREILANCPLAIDEDLLRDLAEYKKYRNKNVSMAARSLIQLFRHTNPRLLHKRDRGRPTEADKELVPIKSYGESRVAAGLVPGTECLVKTETAINESGDESIEDDSDAFSTIEEEGGNEIEEDEEEVLDADPGSVPTAGDVETSASALNNSHIFTQEEFRRIRKYNLKKHLEPYRKRKLELEAKNNSNMKKQKKVDKESNQSGQDNVGDDGLDDSVSDEDENEEEEQRGELPRLADIEHLHKRPKMDRQARMESVQAGREGREKFGRPKPKGSHVGRTNKKLARNKVFSMVRRKEAKKMKRRSFREKQIALRKYLINQRKL